MTGPSVRRNLTERLVDRRHKRGWKKIARQMLSLHHIDLPDQVEVGENLVLLHRGVGTIIHPAAKIGNNVTLAHQVTVGMADALTPVPESAWPAVMLEDDVVVGAGAKILAPRSGLVVGKGTTIGANAVLLQSTGRNEVWVGVPAKRVK